MSDTKRWVRRSICSCSSDKRRRPEAARMKARVVVAAWCLLIGAAVSDAFGQSVAGDWQGTLRAGAMNLRLAVHIAADPDGKLNGTLDSLDQGATGIRIGVITVTDRQVTFTVPAVAGSFTGRLSDDGNSIDGSWTQGASLPLILTRGAPAAAPRRPQT